MSRKEKDIKNLIKKLILNFGFLLYYFKNIKFFGLFKANNSINKKC